MVVYLLIKFHLQIFNANGQYRVYLKATAFDIVTSIVLAFWTTLTVKTVMIESCQNQEVINLNTEEVNTLIRKKEFPQTNNPEEAPKDQPENESKENTPSEVKKLSH